MHKHSWGTIPVIQNSAHKEGNKYLSLFVTQICDCGAYQVKELTNIEDIKK